MGLQKFFKTGELYGLSGWQKTDLQSIHPNGLPFEIIISLLFLLVITSYTIIVYSKGRPYGIAHWGSPLTGRRVSVMSTTLWTEHAKLSI